MLITIRISPAIESQLRVFAARHDADGVRNLLLDACTPAVDAILELDSTVDLTSAEFEALAEELAAGFAAAHGSDRSILSDHAVNRAGIYQDHA